jgi:MSHA pilin protein MshA
MGRQSQRGFTLIELVVVIVILGILAAFAVPKFMGLETRARIASLNAMSGTLRSSAAMAHGVWLAMGTSPASITVEGKAIKMTNGYPDISSLASLIQDTSGYTYTPADGKFVPVGASVAASCYIQYVNAASAAAPYTINYGGKTTIALAEATFKTAC